MSNELIGHRYEVSDVLLGKGSFSHVFLGYDRTVGIRLAIKKIRLCGKNSLQKTEQEVMIMKQLNHSNIVRYYDLIKTDVYWYIVLEYCNAGTLGDVIRYNKTLTDYGVRELTAKYYLNQLKNALEHIRMYGYIHRDIKPHNALLTCNGQFDRDNLENYKFERGLILKLADFGLARNYNNTTMLQTICGSPLYMAPELLNGTIYDDKSELWSFGIVTYELIFCSHPIPAKNISDLRIKTDIQIPSDQISYQCHDLLKTLLTNDPKHRLSWDCFIGHRWFSDLSISQDSLSDSSNSSLLSISPEPNEFESPKRLSFSNLTKTIVIPKQKYPSSCPLNETRKTIRTLSLH